MSRTETLPMPRSAMSRSAASIMRSRVDLPSALFERGGETTRSERRSRGFPCLKRSFEIGCVPTKGGWPMLDGYPLEGDPSRVVVPEPVVKELLAGAGIAVPPPTGERLVLKAFGPGIVH